MKIEMLKDNFSDTCTCKKNKSERGDFHIYLLFNVSKHVTCCHIFNSITFKLNDDM